MSELNKYGVDAKTWKAMPATERAVHYRRLARWRLNNDPDRLAVVRRKRLEYQQKRRTEVREDPTTYAKWLDTLRVYRERRLDKLKNEPDTLAKHQQRRRAYQKRYKADSRKRFQPEAFGVRPDKWAKLTAQQQTNFIRRYVSITAGETANEACNQTLNKYGVREDVWALLPSDHKQYYYRKFHTAMEDADPERRERRRKSWSATFARRQQRVKSDPKLSAAQRGRWRARYHADIERSRQRARDKYQRNRDLYRARDRARYWKHHDIHLERGRRRWRSQSARRSIRARPSEVRDLIERSIPREIPSHVRGDVAATMLLAVLEGKLQLVDVNKEARIFIRAHYREFDTYKTVSLDAPVWGREGTTYLDLLSSSGQGRLNSIRQ